MTGQQEQGWERTAIENIALAGLKEQRRARRWRTFFRLLIFAYIFFLTYAIMFQPENMVSSKDILHKHYTAVIDIKGKISADDEANAMSVVNSLNKAYESKNVKGVILKVNSPGGSPVQSRIIFNEIKRLQAKNPKIKTFAVIEDVGASGAYLISAAADEIYADATSLVGSIGVIYNGFGFVDLIDKLGVERRMYTAGDNKGLLDPFSPVKTEEKEFWQKQLKSIHNAFINNVKTGRGQRLRADESDIFSGRFWTGEQALELGLIDGFADVNMVARDIIKAPKLVDYTESRDLVRKFAKRFGNAMQQGLLQVQDKFL